MRLPQHLVESPWFLHSTAEAFHDAYPQISAEEFQIAQQLVEQGLPPVSSLETLSVLFGYNPGIVRAFAVNSNRYYRKFKIQSGQKRREIASPRVGLKLIQTWIGFHLSRKPMISHIFGFVPGRSHIDAVEQHIGATWAYSVDIQDFFGTTQSAKVLDSMIALGYSAEAAELLTNLTTLDGVLPQGSPASPSISNHCFRETDIQLSNLAGDLECNLTRFADDICFSGTGVFPEPLPEQIEAILAPTPWRLNPSKVSKQPIKGRVKVHGLLVKQDGIALTKGYRNKIRAYRHLWTNRKIRESDVKKIKGHLNFARQVETRATCHSQFDWTDFDFDESKASAAPQNPLISLIKDFLQL
mgnify:CR=1 FL=1